MGRLGLGIIGAGSRGMQSFAATFCRHHADSTRLVALADPNPVRARGGLAWLGIEADVHEGADELVARDDIDAVVVTSPDHLHAEHVVAALGRGKHVFVDKPLATTTEGCLRCIEAARRADRLLYMGFNLRHQVKVRQLHRMAREGAFGDIFSIQAIEYYNGGRTYFSRWNRLKQNTGGLWIHKGSHDFDVINHLMGTHRPARVACFAGLFTFKRERLPFEPDPGVEPGPTCNDCAYQERCPDKYVIPPSAETASGSMFNPSTAAVDKYHKNLCMYLSDKDAHDQGFTIIEFDNGATAQHFECFATPVDGRVYVVDGTEAHAETDRGNTVRFYPRWSRDEVVHNLREPEGGHGGADPVMIREFLDCVRTGRRPTASGIDGTWSVAVGVAAEKARAERRVVEISAVLDTGSELLAPAT